LPYWSRDVIVIEVIVSRLGLYYVVIDAFWCCCGDMIGTVVVVAAVVIMVPNVLLSY
jgi:hypothetical protein